MKYYEIHCETPCCGEDAYEYAKSDDYEKVKQYAWECTYVIKEITKEEYEEMCPWDAE